VGTPKSRGQGTGHKEGRKEGKKSEPNGESSFKNQTFLPSTPGPAFPPTSEHFFGSHNFKVCLLGAYSTTERKNQRYILFFILFII